MIVMKLVIYIQKPTFVLPLVYHLNLFCELEHGAIFIMMVKN